MISYFFDVKAGFLIVLRELVIFYLLYQYFHILLIVSLYFKYYQPVLLRDLFNCVKRTFTPANAPLKLSYDEFSIRMLEKLRINGEISGVMLDDEELIGFMLHSRAYFQGIDTIYNGGTGIVPAYRERGLFKIYKNLLPRLKESGANRILLEVIIPT